VCTIRYSIKRHCCDINCAFVGLNTNNKTARITIAAIKVLLTETCLPLASIIPSNYSGNYTYYVSRSRKSAFCQHIVHLNRDSSPPLLVVAPPLPCSLPPVAPTSCRRFCVFGNMAAFFCTSSFRLFLGLPARLVTWRLPSKLRFVVRHPFYMPSPLQSFPTHVRYPVSVCTFVQCMSTCSVTHSTLIFSLLSGDEFRPKMADIIRSLYSNMNANRY